MKVLSLHDGHVSTAALTEDGRVLSVISEERLNRVKFFTGFPEMAIREVLREAGCSPDDVDEVVSCSWTTHYELEKLNADGPSRVASKIALSVVNHLPYPLASSTPLWKAAHWLHGAVGCRPKLIRRLRDEGFRTQPVRFMEHHVTHAATAYYASGFRGPTLVITCDGHGDGLAGSISIADGAGLERVKEIPMYDSMAKFYKTATKFVGLRPGRDEYKLMGLAPYAGRNGPVLNIYDELRRWYAVDGRDPLRFVNRSRRWSYGQLALMDRRFRFARFDHFAGAVQRVTEDVITEWIANVVREYRIPQLALAGGLFMNVKVNRRILDLPGVERVFVMPSSGDESLVIGAGLWVHDEAQRRQGAPWQAERLDSLYLGPSYGDEEIERAIRNTLDAGRYQVERCEDVAGRAAKALAEGRTVGWFAGRMEFGARALGNRSILADPRNLHLVRELNNQVKCRDFWMPFAPAILAERIGDYVVLPKAGCNMEHMTVAFDTTARGQSDLIAALHPYDMTARVQLVRRDLNPGFWDVIKRFEALTGVGAVLNTSFNLHDEPLVCTPEEALSTLQRSGLDCVALERWFITRRSPS